MYCQPWSITTLKRLSRDYCWRAFPEKENPEHLDEAGPQLSDPEEMLMWVEWDWWTTYSDKRHSRCIEHPVLRITYLLRGQGGCSVFAGAEPQVNTTDKSSPREHYRTVTVQHSCMPLLRESHNCGEKHPLNLGWINRGLELVWVLSTNQQVIYLMMQ